MDLSSMLPLLMQLLGQNQQQGQSLQQQANLPQEVLNSYPTTYINSSQAEKPLKQEVSQPQAQNNLSPLMSLLGGGSQNPLKMLESLLPSLNKVQKNNSPKISELKSIDEYTFD